MYNGVHFHIWCDLAHIPMAQMLIQPCLLLIIVLFVHFACVLSTSECFVSGRGLKPKDGLNIGVDFTI